MITGQPGFVSNGQATYSGSFQIQGILVVRPTIADGTQSNGINPIEIGIFTNPSPIVGAAGASYFGTNTSLSDLAGSTLGASAIDVAIVKMDQANNSVNIQLDGNITGLPRARLNVFNIYNLTSGVTAQIHNILDGTIDISFDGKNIQGALDLGGSSGFQGPFITSLYRGTFSGARR